jgi:hypothetical protein
MFTDLHRIPEQLPGEPPRRQSASAIALVIAKKLIGLLMMCVFMPPLWLVLTAFRTGADLPLLPVTIGAAVSGTFGRLALAGASNQLRHRLPLGTQRDAGAGHWFARGADRSRGVLFIASAPERSAWHRSRSPMPSAEWCPIPSGSGRPRGLSPRRRPLSARTSIEGGSRRAGRVHPGVVRCLGAAR